VLRHLLRTSDLTPADLERLLALAAAFKTAPYRARERLRNETVVLYFNKPSTRTRISFETAVARLGGTPIGVGPADLQLGRGETIEDTAGVLSRYARAFVIRTFAHADVERFAATSAIPVVNALTDAHHPCQSLADLLTLREKKGELAGRKLAYVGAGNNVTHSLLEAAALAGLRISVATPAEYAPDAAIVSRARELARATGAVIEVGVDPLAAVRDADAVYTDAWLSMGDPDSERAQRLARLGPYQADARLMACARPDAIFMHCLPDHRGEEVTAEVVDGPRSVVFDQAENRLHTAVAVLSALLDSVLEGSACAS
jgi:ornithine carbamoyltransferase